MNVQTYQYVYACMHVVEGSPSHFGSPLSFPFPIIDLYVLLNGDVLSFSFCFFSVLHCMFSLVVVIYLSFTTGGFS